jgi:hypothetical protein
VAWNGERVAKRNLSARQQFCLYRHVIASLTWREAARVNRYG